jgi:serine/threonine-protein kinase RsbW
MGRLPAAPSDQPVVTRWPNTPRTVGRAREELARTLCSWELGHLEDTAALVLSELVTNAVRHAKSPRGRLIETRYCRQGDGVRIEVHDANSSQPVLRHACEWDDGGRGLALVDILTAHRWGVSSRTGTGKLVWAVVTE